MRAAVIGAGAWGTAMARLLALKGHDVRLWAFEEGVVAAVNAGHENPQFLPGAALPESVTATPSHRDAVAEAGLVVYATPAQHLRAIAAAGARHVWPGATLVVAAKGIERGSLALMSDVIEHEVPGHDVVALSGPSFAAEVAAGLPTAVVAASRNRDAARTVQEAYSGAAFRVYTHDD
ncbi:MAG: NAD(P)-binding domain-containing protein, partial [Gemmatimonadota bacterium]|nr:NAD(P)-binding domain-containing protein [Gemmatimonadota bacterium]